MGARVSQVKPSDCFQAPRKISFTFHFSYKSFILDDVKLAELFSNSFEKCDILWVKTYSDPSNIFSAGQDPNPPIIYIFFIYCFIVLCGVHLVFRQPAAFNH